MICAEGSLCLPRLARPGFVFLSTEPGIFFLTKQNGMAYSPRDAEKYNFGAFEQPLRNPSRSCVTTSFRLGFYFLPKGIGDRKRVSDFR